MSNFNDLDPKLQLILYLRATRDMGNTFCTCDPKLHKAADALISEGTIIEIEGPGGSDRAFKLAE